MMYSLYLLLSLTGCVNDDIITNRASSEYFPSKIGNYWEYSVTDSTDTSDGVKKYTLTITITGTKVMADGKQASIWKYQFPKWAHSSSYPDEGVDTVYVRIENDTVKTFTKGYLSIKSLTSFPRQVFPIPFKDGQKWNGKLLVIDKYAANKISDGFQIDYYYLGPNIEYNDKLFFKPNIGFVELDMSHYDLGPIDHQIWKLEKYSLN